MVGLLVWMNGIAKWEWTEEKSEKRQWKEKKSFNIRFFFPAFNFSSVKQQERTVRKMVGILKLMLENKKKKQKTKCTQGIMMRVKMESFSSQCILDICFFFFLFHFPFSLYSRTFVSSIFIYLSVMSLHFIIARIAVRGLIVFLRLFLLHFMILKIYSILLVYTCQ